MTDQSTEKSALHTISKLPFGLTNLNEAKITFFVQPSKQGTGKDEIVIHGTGEVEFSMTATQASEPEVHRGNVSQEIVQRLFEFFEAAEFVSLDEEYLGEGELGGEMAIELNAGATNYKVSIVGGEVLALDRFIGAVKLVAWIADPELMRGGFFRYI